MSCEIDFLICLVLLNLIVYLHLNSTQFNKLVAITVARYVITTMVLADGVSSNGNSTIPTTNAASGITPSLTTINATVNTNSTSITPTTTTNATLIASTPQVDMTTSAAVTSSASNQRTTDISKSTISVQETLITTPAVDATVTLMITATVNGSAFTTPAVYTETASLTGPIATRTISPSSTVRKTSKIIPKGKCE